MDQQPEPVHGLEWLAGLLVVGVFIVALAHAPTASGTPLLAAAANTTPTNNTNNNYCGTPTSQASSGSVNEQCMPGCEYQVDLASGGTPQVIVIKSPPANMTPAQKAALPAGQVTYITGGSQSVQVCNATGKDASGNPTYSSFSSLNGGAGVSYTENGVTAIGNGISNLFGSSPAPAPTTVSGSELPYGSYSMFSGTSPDQYISSSAPDPYAGVSPTDFFGGANSMIGSVPASDVYPTTGAGLGGGPYAGAPSTDLVQTPSYGSLSPEDQYEYPNVQPISELNGAGGGPYAGAPAGDFPTTQVGGTGGVAVTEALPGTDAYNQTIGSTAQTPATTFDTSGSAPAAASPSSGGIGGWFTNNIVNPIGNLFGSSSAVPASSNQATVGPPTPLTPEIAQQTSSSNQVGFLEPANFQQEYSTGVVNPSLPPPSQAGETICPVGLEASSCSVWEQCLTPGGGCQ